MEDNKDNKDVGEKYKELFLCDEGIKLDHFL
jgi:hypothetical protein